MPRMKPSAQQPALPHSGGWIIKERNRNWMVLDP
jgi:hypothetical protein